MTDDILRRVAEAIAEVVADPDARLTVITLPTPEEAVR